MNDDHPPWQRTRLVEVINTLNVNVVGERTVELFKRAAVLLIEGGMDRRVYRELSHIYQFKRRSWYITSLAERVLLELG